MALISGSGGAVFVGTDETHSDVVITPVGELDLAFGPTVLAAIREAIAGAPRRIVLDLASVTFLDSGGGDMLAEAQRDARKAGVRLELRTEMTPMVRRILTVTMLLDAFDPAD